MTGMRAESRPGSTPPSEERLAKPTFLFVATEWFSRHGGLSTFNRNLCIELAAAGCAVFCFVPSCSAEEERAARDAGVSLLVNQAIPGLVDAARLCRRPPLPPMTKVDFVVGHAHITGPAATALVEDFLPSARRIHFFHTAPEEIAPLKGSGAALADGRVQLELELATSAALTVAVGPRLDAEWSTQMHGRARRPPRYQLQPWIAVVDEVVSEPPPLRVCMVLGRTEDYRLKGLDIAARSVGLILGAPSPPRTLLVVRGIQGDEDALRQQLVADAKRPLPDLRLRGYTADEARLQEDIRSASVLLMPSRAEGFGLVGMEALSNGIPILVSSCSGLGEVLSRVGNGAETFVVPTTGDIEIDGPAWRKAIAEVLDDRASAFKRTAEVRHRLLSGGGGQEAVRSFLRFLAQFFPAGGDALPTDPSDPDFGDVAALAPVLPSAAMLSAFARLEGEVRRLGERLSPEAEGLRPSVEHYIDVLAKSDLVEEKDTDLLRDMNESRSRLVQGTAVPPPTQDEATRFVDDARRLHQHLQLRTIPTDFVRLERHVLDLNAATDEDVEARVARSLGLRELGLVSPLMTWDELLGSSRHAVVLGEPGAGKTWELRALAANHTSDAGRAYFVRLEFLLDAPELALHGVDLAGDGPVLLLLDALDESKLRNMHALERCLRTLAVHARDAWPRLRLIVSCRVSDWQPRADGETLSRLLPPAPATDEFKNFVRIVGLAPLTDEQILRLAGARGVPSAEVFLRELTAAGARGLCARPRDVIDLIEYWNRHGKLGRLGELLEDNVTRRLTQPDTRLEPVPLSLDEARDGAERLAAAMALGRTLTVLLPDEVVKPERDAGSIRPEQALPGWDARKIRTLLSRPIFDEATLGRVRFHHRTTADYLAACWVRRLLSRGGDPSKVQSLFVSERLGRQVVFRSMAPVAAWVASWDTGFLELLASRSPEILMQAGDPQGLPVAFRERVLKDFAQRNRERVRVARSNDWGMLARFAHPDLAPTIVHLLRENRGNADLCLELMRVAVAGGLSGCVDVATEYAVDSSQDTWVRRAAIDLIAEVGSSVPMEALRGYLEAAERVEPRVLYRLWSRLFPRFLQIDGLLTSIRKHLAAVAADPTSDATYTLEYELVPQCPVGQLEALLVGLCQLAPEAPAGAARAWVLDGAGLTVLRLLREVPTDRVPIGATLTAIELNDQIDSNDAATHLEMTGHASTAAIREASLLHPTLRRALFLQRIRSDSRLTGLTMSPLGLFPQDLEWLLLDVVDPASAVRAQAFEAACALVKAPSDEFERLAAVVTDSPELSARLAALMSPPRSDPRPYEVELAQRRQREQEQVESSRLELSACLDEIRAGTHFNALSWLVRRYEGFSRDGEFKWDQLREEMGSDMVDATRTGLGRAWQLLEIPPRGETGNRVPGEVVIGLVGIKCFFETGSVRDLPLEAATKAARLATWELNKLPSWISELATIHGNVVRDVILDVVRAELWGPDDHAFLGRIAAGPAELVSLVAPHVIGLLVSRETDARYSLRIALKMAVDRTEDHVALKGILPQRLETSRGEAHLLWILAGLAVDAEPTLDFLERKIRADPTNAGAFFVELLSFAHRGSLPLPVDASAYRAQTLSRLVSMIYDHIRPVDDECPEGAHSPSAREDAQHERSRLLQLLGSQTSEDAHAALVALTRGGHITEQSTLEWIEEMAQQIAERLAQGPAWSPSQVVEFERQCARGGRGESSDIKSHGSTSGWNS